MSDLTDYEVTEAMIQFGGSFVRGLGELYRRADEHNKAKLRMAFPEYFAEYRDLAIRTSKEMK